MKAINRTAQRLGGKSRASYDDDFITKVGEMEKLEKNLRELFEASAKFIDCHHKNSSKDFEVLAKRQPDRISPYQDVGHSIKTMGETVLPADPRSKKIVKLGVVMKLIGQEENDFTAFFLKSYLSTVNEFLTCDCEEFKQQYKILESCRHDYDAAFTKVEKANEQASKNPKKGEANEKAQAELVKEQERFNQQYAQVTRKLNDTLEKNIMKESVVKEIMAALIKHHEKSLDMLKQTNENL